MRLMLFIILLTCSSCEYLLSPPAIAIEEEIAIEVIKEIEHELEKPKE